jgi:subtilase family serine protease
MVKNKSSKRTSVRKKKAIQRISIQWPLVGIVLFIIAACLFRIYYDQSHATLSSFRATPYYSATPLIRPGVQPQLLLTPTSVKSTYNITGTKNIGTGTIAIIDAYNDPNIQNDLNVFDTHYGVAACTAANNCLEVHRTTTKLILSPTWAVEESLDTEWAHAIAPGAHILIVEAQSDSGTDLLNAIKYATSRSDVKAISMSWGGSEFNTEASYESTFTDKYGAVFFASSGDSGHGTSWPSVSANVISVGGTTIKQNTNGTFASEVAWPGSGGGVSTFIPEPARQVTYHVLNAGGHRATPDVSYDADPNSGFPVYDTLPYYGYAGWFQVGGTSAGAPQWAALETLSGGTLTANQLYLDAAKAKQTALRDITTGTNGNCALYCTAGTGYDYVTGLGSPIQTSF